jgi:hypothetical protein
VIQTTRHSPIENTHSRDLVCSLSEAAANRHTACRLNFRAMFDVRLGLRRDSQNLSALSGSPAFDRW